MIRMQFTRPTRPSPTMPGTHAASYKGHIGYFIVRTLNLHLKRQTLNLHLNSHLIRTLNIHRR